VVRVDPSSEDEGWLEESSEPVVAAVVLTCAVVVVSAPIEPSKATTPQASTNDARTAAITRWRIAEIRRARAARRSWAEGMTKMVGAGTESAL
jgi:hypothetical protein